MSLLAQDFGTSTRQLLSSKMTQQQRQKNRFARFLLQKLKARKGKKLRGGGETKARKVLLQSTSLIQACTLHQYGRIHLKRLKRIKKYVFTSYWKLKQ